MRQWKPCSFFLSLMAITCIRGRNTIVSKTISLLNYLKVGIVFALGILGSEYIVKRLWQLMTKTEASSHPTNTSGAQTTPTPPNTTSTSHVPEGFKMLLMIVLLIVAPALAKALSDMLESLKKERESFCKHIKYRALRPLALFSEVNDKAAQDTADIIIDSINSRSYQQRWILAHAAILLIILAGLAHLIMHSSKFTEFMEELPTLLSQATTTENKTTSPTATGNNTSKTTNSPHKPENNSDRTTTGDKIVKAAVAVILAFVIAALLTAVIAVLGEAATIRLCRGAAIEQEYYELLVPPEREDIVVNTPLHELEDYNKGKGKLQDLLEKLTKTFTETSARNIAIILQKNLPGIIGLLAGLRSRLSRGAGIVTPLHVYLEEQLAYILPLKYNKKTKEPLNTKVKLEVKLAELKEDAKAIDIACNKNKEKDEKCSHTEGKLDDKQDEWEKKLDQILDETINNTTGENNTAIFAVALPATAKIKLTKEHIQQLTKEQRIGKILVIRLTKTTQQENKHNKPRQPPLQHIIRRHNKKTTQQETSQAWDNNIEQAKAGKLLAEATNKALNKLNQDRIPLLLLALPPLIALAYGHELATIRIEKTCHYSMTQQKYICINLQESKQEDKSHQKETQNTTPHTGG